MLKVWGIIEEELWERTFRNLNETEFQIQDLRDVLPNLPKIPARQDRRQYVLKSESHCYGAGSQSEGRGAKRTVGRRCVLFPASGQKGV